MIIQISNRCYSYQNIFGFNLLSFHFICFEIVAHCASHASDHKIIIIEDIHSALGSLNINILWCNQSQLNSCMTSTSTWLTSTFYSRCWETEQVMIDDHDWMEHLMRSKFKEEKWFHCFLIKTIFCIYFQTMKRNTFMWFYTEAIWRVHWLVKYFSRKFYHAFDL